MVIDMNYWSKVFRKILILLFTILGVYIAFKFAIFYMPFLIAFVLSLIIEPIIRFFMRNFKLKRKASSIIVFIVALSLIIGLLVWGVISLISEASNLLNGLNDYFVLISNKFNSLMNNIDLEKLNLSSDIISTIQSSAIDVLSSVTEWAKGVLSNLLEIITSIPTMMIYVVITILSLYFICTDKIYMIDQFEHHIPEQWVKKLWMHLKDITKALGCYLKAQAILILVSFIISIIGLYIYKIIGLKIEYPLLIALAIGFVDALPILGSGTVMVPWAVFSAINGDLKLGLAILILWGIMSAVRQIIEPRIVSNQIGIHPIFTLISMYTGYKFIGIMGMIVGPIILIILKNIFATLIDKGVLKAIFDR